MRLCNGRECHPLMMGPGAIALEEDDTEVKSDISDGSNVSSTNSRDVGCGNDDCSDPTRVRFV